MAQQLNYGERFISLAKPKNMWFVLPFLIPAADPIPLAQLKPPPVAPAFVCNCRQPACCCARTFQSHSFSTWCGTSRFHAGEIAVRCEAMRREFQQKWLGEAAEASWNPRCQIVVHATRGGYLAAVGAGASNTSGCSTIQVNQQQVVVRRIDLVGEDTSRAMSALAHELTHVVLADRFAGHPLPRWADEGIATLADNADKQSRHQRDLMEAFRRGTTMRLATLLATEDYPSQSQIPAFYGQSVSLVKFLCTRKPPAEVVRFIETGRRSGYDAALQSHYDINGLGQLDSEWRHVLLQSDQNRN